jgi:proline iminopeptidase
MLVHLACGRPQPAPAAENAAESSVREGYVAMPDGARLFYRRVGEEGVPVILVPGLFLGPDLDRLAAGRTLIYLDPRNRGRSDSVQDSTLLTIQQELKDLEEVRKHFGFEQIDLVGYSYAGLLVALYAMDNPGRVRRMVQLGPVPRDFETEYPEVLTAVTPPEITAQLQSLDTLPADYRSTHPREYCELAWMASRARLVGDPANVEKLGAGPCAMENEWPANFARQIRYHFGSVQRLDIAVERIRSIDIPVLVVHGTLDRNAAYGAGREWAMTLPNARLLTVRGAAHQSWVEAPDLILGAIEAFLRGEWPAGAEQVTTLLPPN